MSENPNDAPALADLRQMDQEPVLVNPGASRENPPVGLRGTIRVTPENTVEIDLQFAVMFDRPAANRTIRLSPAQVAALRASKAKYSEYVLNLDHPIDSPAATVPDVVPNLL
jgi:hypothetical protein